MRLAYHSAVKRKQLIISNLVHVQVKEYQSYRGHKQPWHSLLLQTLAALGTNVPNQKSKITKSKICRIKLVIKNGDAVE